jgi:hypothetical protein
LLANAAAIASDDGSNTHGVPTWAVGSSTSRRHDGSGVAPGPTSNGPARSPSDARPLTAPDANASIGCCSGKAGQEFSIREDTVP